MSALLGERDRLIMSTVPRYFVSVVEKALLLAVNTPVFAVSAGGVATPAAITITAELVSITGTVEFSVSAGAALTVDGKVATLRFVDMSVDAVFVQAKVKDAESGVEFLRSAVISKVFDGANGAAGADGATYYTWVKYGDSANGTGLSDSPAGKAWIGLAYNKATPVEGVNPADYSWSLIKGTDGVPGAPGADGLTTYTWIKYSDLPDGTGLYDVPTAATLYLGLATNKTTAIESGNKEDYVWSKFRGDQGVPGAPGAAAPTLYTWVKYADSSAGAGLSDDPTGKAWIGLAYNKLTPVESLSAGDYAWSLIRGADGVPGSDGANGLPGVKGADGQTFYTWIRYADAPDGAGMYDTPNANTLYLGLSTNRTSQAEGSNPADYVWSKFKGDQGVPGTAAPTLYTWIKYADSAAGAGLTDSPDGKAFIGLAYNRTTAAESADPAQYNWSLIKGADGQPGTKGTDGQTLYTWIKYADFADGTGLYDVPGPNTLYIGLSVNRPVQSESGNKEDYVWSKFKGDQGVPGTTGPQGQRGTKTVVVGGYSTWSDASATAELAAAGFGAPINRDVVTLYGPIVSAPTFTLTKFFDNGSWLSMGTHIDGGLLVNGTVAAPALSVDRLSALSGNLGSIVAGDIHGVSLRGGAFTSYNWPENGGLGFFLSQAGLLMGNPSTGRYLQIGSEGNIYMPGMEVVNGRAMFSGNVVSGSGTGFRVEMGPDDPVYAMWAGAGAKNDVNAIFYLKRSGAAYFGGALSAGTLKTAVTNPELNPNAQLVDGPFGSNGGAINVVCSLSWLYSRASTRDRYTAGAGTNTATITLYRKIGDGAEQVVQSGTFSGPTEIVNTLASEEKSTCQQSIQGSFTYTDTAGSTTNRTYRAVLSLAMQSITVTARPGGTGGADQDSAYQRLTIITTE